MKKSSKEQENSDAQEKHSSSPVKPLIENKSVSTSKNTPLFKPLFWASAVNKDPLMKVILDTLKGKIVSKGV